MAASEHGWRMAERTTCPRRRPGSAALLVLAAAFAAGCLTRQSVRPLADDSGRPVALEYRCPVRVLDAASGQPLAGAVVYLGNDEDPVVQIAWTDGAGQALLAQRYARGSTIVHERTVLGLFATEVGTEVRYPRFVLRAARAGYLPVQMQFGSEAFGPQVELGPAGAFVQLSAPAALALERVPAGAPPMRHVALLFAAPPRAAVRLGARGAAWDERYLRVVAGGQITASLDACVRALLGPAGQRIAIAASVPAAHSVFQHELEALLGSCDEVHYVPPLGAALRLGEVEQSTGPPQPELREQERALRLLVARLGLVAERPEARPAAWRRIDGATSGAAPAPEPDGAAARFLDAVRGWAALEDEAEVRAHLPALALAFAAAVESNRPEAARRAAHAVLHALHHRTGPHRTLGVVCGPEVAVALERLLRERGYRVLAETWLPAWQLR
ncbi:MAG: hypothetical protein KatS3mg102_0614 [Planctomycetota bacterium]|nr:MAG: hypothetical protein KatS3mg102_0614 [Planctomycetota bacterium]